MGMTKAETLVIAVIVLAGAAFFVPYRDVALIQSMVVSFCSGLLQ
ncbi:MAG TPA: hypothetical protein VIG92_00170 [Rhodospirillales bacterium]|jgi:hypothetical protein